MKSRYSKRIVLLVILLNIAYASAALYILLKNGSESPTLTVSWFGFTTTELLAIAGIRVIKAKNTESSDTATHFNETIAQSIDTQLGGVSNEIDIPDDLC